MLRGILTVTVFTRKLDTLFVPHLSQKYHHPLGVVTVIPIKAL